MRSVLSWLLLILLFCTNDTKSADINYGCYFLSQKCRDCLDSIHKNPNESKGITYTQQERDCLIQELMNVQAQLKEAYQRVEHLMATYQNRVLDLNIKKTWHDRLNILEKTQQEFLAFINIFTRQNSHLYEVKSANFIEYCEKIDFFNLQIKHLDNYIESMGGASALSESEIDETFSSILDGILSSSQEKEITIAESARIEGFLRQYNVVKNPHFGEQWWDHLMHNLDLLYKEEKNVKAKALIEKLKTIFQK